MIDNTENKKDGMHYYDELLQEFNILGYVKNYQQDVLYHDREQFKAMKGDSEFMHFSRPCGSHVISFQHVSDNMRNIWFEHHDTGRLKGEITSWRVSFMATLNSNKQFIHGDKGIMKSVDRETALIIFNAFLMKELLLLLDVCEWAYGIFLTNR